MSYLDRVFARTAKAVPTSPARPGRLRANAGYEKDSIPDPSRVEHQAQLYASQVWIQNAIIIPAQMAAATPLQVLRVTGEDTAPIKNHDFEQLLLRPNPYQSRFEFLTATFAWRGAAGMAYWWLNKRSEDAPPDEIFIIPPSQIAPVPDGTMGIRGYVYDPGGGEKPQPLEPWEIVQFKLWNPLNKYVGLSPLQALAMDARADLAAQAYNRGFFADDNAKADGILAFADNIDDHRWERLIAERNQKHGGVKNNRVMMMRNVGAGGVQWIQTALTRTDMQYIEHRQFTKEAIYDRLAPGLASALAINSNEANARAGQANLREMAIYPAHVAMAETIALHVLPSYGDALTCAFDDVRHKDRQLEIQETDQYARFHTIDEVRQHRFGSPPDPARGTLFAAEIGKAAAPHPMQPAVEALPIAQKMLDRQRWAVKVSRALAAGKTPESVPFTPDYLSDDEAMQIRAALKRARSAEDVAQAFREG